MVCLELADEVRVRATDDGEIRLRVSGPAATADIPCDESNLVWRAARAWLDLCAERHGDSRGVEIELEKNVPSQAGLGGGSSDAAATILASADALQLPIENAALEALLAKLGSDCVFFRSAAMTGAALCQGRGERVSTRRAPSPAWFVSILVPEVRVPTSTVFDAIEMSLRGFARAPSFNPEVLQLTAVAARHWLINDLEHPALKSFQELRSWRDMLDGVGLGHYCLAGSGATFFGVFDTRAEADESTRVILEQARERGLSVRASLVTQTISHAAQILSD